MPYTIHYAEPISPLKHPHSSVDRLIFCAEKGMPAIYSPAPIAGSTAPMTIAGHVVQGLAECLFGLVIHQLTAKGAPFLMGIGTAIVALIIGSRPQGFGFAFTGVTGSVVSLLALGVLGWLLFRTAIVKRD